MRQHRPDDGFDAAVDVLTLEQIRAFLKSWRRSAENGDALADAVVALAARGAPTWSVPTGGSELIDEARGFIEAARRVSMANPDGINDLFRRAGRSFLARDYATARAVYEIVFTPLADAEIDLGQDETYDEVLSDLHEVGTRYLVSVYESTPLARRAPALFQAFGLLEGIATPWHPLKEMKEAATRPLSELDRFATLWSEYLHQYQSELPEFQRKQMLLEAVEHAAGAKGLERAARETRSYEAFRAWCVALARDNERASLYAALREAAASTDKHSAASFCDVAAAIALEQRMHGNVSDHLASAYETEPSMRRLCRLLMDGEPTTAEIRRRAKRLLSKGVTSPRLAALLEILVGERAAAAARLVKAPGLGWSREEHPGHIVFPLLVVTLGGAPPATSVRAETCAAILTQDLRDAEWVLYRYDAGESLAESVGVKLPAAVTLAKLIERSEPDPVGRKERDALVSSLRAGAERRIEGVTSEKRRRQYEHAARLAVSCAELEAAIGIKSDWLARVRADNTRWPALQSEFQRAIAQSAPRVG